MTYKASTYFNKITTDLLVLARTVEVKNKLALTDDAKWGELFFCDLLNLIYGYKLVDLNAEEGESYAGIDLGDSENRICIQVTGTSTSEKIKKTLEVSDKYNRQNEYDTLIVLIIGTKQKYPRVTFSSKFSNFNKDEHIWDIHNVLRKIKTLSPEQMKTVADFIDSRLEGVISIDPNDLIEDDIASIIDLLFLYVCEGVNIDENSDKKYLILQRDENFILRKNELNNVDDLLFNNEIRDSLSYDKKIEEFLSNPINISYQNKYFNITEELQKKYAENSDTFSNIGELFNYVYTELITYENRNKIDGYKLLIVLHNMYFNCDIGNNPQ